MKFFSLIAVLGAMLSGCATIQHADEQAGMSYRAEIEQRYLTARHKQDGSDAVRLAAVQGANTTVVKNVGAALNPPCPGLTERENEFKRVCEDHTEGSGDVNEDREVVCASLRATIDMLRDSCGEEKVSGEMEVVFAPAKPPDAGVHINLTGASTGDIRFIIQSPGAADQSVNGAPAQKEAPTLPPESVVTGLSKGLIDALGKAVPWAIGGYALGEFADAFGEGMSNAGDRDNSVDESLTIDKSVGGDQVVKEME